MKQFNVFIATLVLTCFAFIPTTVLAKGLDDLEVTMEVIDTVAGVDDAISEMRGPEGDGIEGGSADFDDDRNNESDGDREDGGDGVELEDEHEEDGSDRDEPENLGEGERQSLDEPR